MKIDVLGSTSECPNSLISLIILIIAPDNKLLTIQI